MKYSFNIDEKSLYFGVKNDFKKGQTATVHTPLNQAKNEQDWKTSIYDFLKGYPSENVTTLSDDLKDKCLKKTTSKADSKIIYFFVFSKFTLDGIPFEVNSSFAMYVKEEISEDIIGRDGDVRENTHFGRQKLHYPTSLTYFSEGYNIENKKVLEKILEANGGFAYVVNGFDIDTESNILNFRTTMIGHRGVLLSNVFKRKKGVGLKLLVDGISLENSIAEVSHNSALTKEETNAFLETLAKIQKSSRANGVLGEEFVFNNIKKILRLPQIDNLLHISKKYPQSPYDIEFYVNGEKKYIEVKSTGKNKKTFIMSKGERLFMEKYDKNYYLILVTNVRSERKNYFIYNRNDIINESKMKIEHLDIKYTVNN